MSLRSEPAAALRSPEAPTIGVGGTEVPEKAPTDWTVAVGYLKSKFSSYFRIGNDSLISTLNTMYIQLQNYKCSDRDTQYLFLIAIYDNLKFCTYLTLDLKD